MATLNPRNGDLTAGVASQSSDVLNPSPNPFVTGDAPAIVTDAYGVAADQDLAARTVVALDGSGHLIPAALGTSEAIGILVYAIDSTGEAAGAVTAEVYVQGVFNPDLVDWPATYDTDEKKRTAFRGQTAPTSIIIRKPETMTVA